MADNAASSSVRNRGRAVISDSTASSVVTSATTMPRSTAAISRRSCDASTSGSPTVRTTRNTDLQVCCAKGRYKTSSAARSSPPYFTFDVTPTTVIFSPPVFPSLSTGRSMVWPSGSRAPNKRRAVSALSITTGGACRSSASVKSRPRSTRTPSARKYPGVTGTAAARYDARAPASLPRLSVTIIRLESGGRAVPTPAALTPGNPEMRWTTRSTRSAC